MKVEASISCDKILETFCVDLQMTSDIKFDRLKFWIFNVLTETPLMSMWNDSSNSVSSDVQKESEGAGFPVVVKKFKY